MIYFGEQATPDGQLVHHAEILEGKNSVQRSYNFPHSYDTNFQNQV